METPSTLDRLLASVVLSLGTASGSWGSQGPERGAPGNVLLIVADDLSVADLAVYGVNPNLPSGLTPNLDRLAAAGVLFERAWANPLCSASRAAILTGRCAFRTGIGETVETARISLDPAETTLAEALRDLAPRPYASAAFGKWHLEAPGSPVASPATELHGFDVFAGTLFEVPLGYCDWRELTSPGIESARSHYMPAALADSALDWIREQQQPWLCYFAPQSPYHLLHVPPHDLQSRVTAGEACAPCDEGEARACFEAALQALDTKIGHLMQGLEDWQRETTIVFTADNGTPNNVHDYWPPQHGKGFLFEGGMHVPLIIAGRGVEAAVRGTRSAELVNVRDLFRTVTTLAGIDELPRDVAEDSLDLGPLLRSPAHRGLRATNLAEKIRHGLPRPPHFLHEVAVRDERFKLIYSCSRDRPLALFDLELDPRELDDLLLPAAPAPGSPAGDALERLRAAIPDEIPRGSDDPRRSLRAYWPLAAVAALALAWLALRARPARSRT